MLFFFVVAVAVDVFFFFAGQNFAESRPVVLQKISQQVSSRERSCRRCTHPADHAEAREYKASQR